MAQSYGEYYDNQYERLRIALSNKDRKEWLEWEERTKKEREVFKPPGECMNTNKAENKKMRGRIARKRRETEL